MSDSQLFSQYDVMKDRQALQILRVTAGWTRVSQGWRLILARNRKALAALAWTETVPLVPWGSRLRCEDTK